MKWKLYKILNQNVSEDTNNREAELSHVIDIMSYLESMINSGLAYALEQKDADKSIYEVLAYIGQSTGSDRAYLFENEGDYVENTYEWCGEGVSAEIDNLKHVPWDDIYLWREAFEKGESVIVPSVGELKETNSVLYDYLEPQQINSLVVSPLISDGKIIGFYGVDNPPSEILNYISDLTWIVAYFLIAMVKQRELVKHLKVLSYFDQLTNLRNRHALFESISQGNFEKHVGVMYCDVMGLKKINDEQGHEAGDALLIRASDCIRRSFRLGDAYRLGGDEFLVVCSNIKEDDFKKRIEKIRVDMKENNAVMALGYVWYETLTNVEEAIVEADKLMYKEKQEIYKKNR